MINRDFIDPKNVRIAVKHSSPNGPTILNRRGMIRAGKIPDEHWDAFWNGLAIPVGPYWIQLDASR